MEAGAQELGYELVCQLGRLDLPRVARARQPRGTSRRGKDGKMNLKAG